MPGRGTRSVDVGAVIVAAVFVIATIAGPQVVSDAARSQVEQAVTQASHPSSAQTVTPSPVADTRG
jgi:Tfp pilus assembly major pilin PilA